MGAGTRMSADERRVAVLRVAREEFGLSGFSGASTEAIARRVGVSQPYLFRLFPTKKAMFLATVNNCFDRVEALFDVEASSALTERQKRRVVAKAGPVLRAVAQDERSQWRNRELALERLAEALREGLKVERRRRPTAPTEASRARRLEEKRRRGATKRLRRPPDEI